MKDKDFLSFVTFPLIPTLFSLGPSIFMKDIWEIYSLQSYTLFLAGLAIQSLIIIKIIIVDILGLKLLKEKVSSEGLKQLAHVVQEVSLHLCGHNV